MPDHASRPANPAIIRSLWFIDVFCVTAFCIGVLAVCAEEQAPAKGVFRAGAAAVDVTPTHFPVIVNDSFNEAQATRAHDRLMSRAVVLDGGQLRLAIVVVDSLMIPRELLDIAKQVAHEATGIPTERMLISATHTHSAPSALACLGSRADPDYPQFLTGQIAKSIQQAAGNLTAAKVGWTVVKGYEHNHCRRWIYRPDRIETDPFGERTVRAHMHPGHQSANHVGPSRPADPDLSLLSIQTAAGRPLVVLANYAMHYYGASPVSADFCGRFGDQLADLIGVEDDDASFVGITSQGTSGDSMWMDYSEPAPQRDLDQYTLEVAGVAHDAYKSIEYQEWVSLAMAETSLKLRRRIADLQRLEWAQSVLAEIGDRLPQSRPKIYAREPIYLHEEPEVEIKLQAIRIGGLGITAIPNEVYGITGLKLKAQGPLVPTFNIELANAAQGYIPPPDQHALGGYTTWPARTAGLEVEAEPKIADALLGLLENVADKPRRSPVAPAWGTDGRPWVAEMADFPLGMDGQGKPGGRIRFLEDTNDDGKYDHSTLFLDGVRFSAGIMPWRDGVLITAAPEILYAEDTDSDGRADKREVLYSGFQEGNQQLRVNGLSWGLDNWIYCANGAHHGTYGPDRQLRAVKTDKTIVLGSRDFRFRPDSGEIKNLAALDTAELVAALDSPNGPQRDLAGQLLQWRGDTSAAALLEKMAQQCSATLDGLESILRIDQTADVLWQFETVAGLLDAIERRGTSLEALVGEEGDRSREMLRQIAALIERARTTILNTQASDSLRAAAVRLLVRHLDQRAEDLHQLRSLLTPQTSPAIQLAVVRHLGSQSDPTIGEILLAGWRSHALGLRSETLSVLASRPGWLTALLDAIEKGQVARAEIDATTRQSLLAYQDKAIRERISRLLADSGNADRRKVLLEHQAALNLAGSSDRGQAVFKTHCANCHKLDDVGHDIGPNLRSLTDSKTSSLLTSILNPSAAVDEKFVTYVVLTDDGRIFTGMIASETANRITLVEKENKQHVILRNQIEEIRSTGLSLMPDGLEKNITHQDFADLIFYIRTKDSKQ